jgi:tetratricopeptide (TPR) repeat protein
MNRSRFPLCLLLAGVLSTARAEPLAGAEPPAGAETIVTPNDQVSAADARQELVRVLRNLGRPLAAEAEIRKLLESRPNDPTLLADVADLEATRGHFARSKMLYERALSSSGNGLEMRLRYARQAQSWGDFYQSERLFRAYLREHPKDTDAMLGLAGVLIAEQRYEAAEGEYRALAKNPAGKQKALIGLANCCLLKKDYQAVLPLTDAVLETHPDQIEALNLRGEALRSLGRYD